MMEIVKRWLLSIWFKNVLVILVISMLCNSPPFTNNAGKSFFMNLLILSHNLFKKRFE